MKNIRLYKERKDAKVVIQSNMSPAAIVEVWSNTAVIFKRHKIPFTKQVLATLIDEEQLIPLLHELNAAVGSSVSTCIDGG